MKVGSRVNGKRPLKIGRHDVTSTFAIEFLSALDSPLAYAAAAGNWKPIVTAAAPDPRLYDDVESFQDAYWAAESWSKYPFDIGADREMAAYRSFIEGEERCYVANGRLVEYFHRARPEFFRRALKEARRRLHWLLGGITPSEVMQRAGWGPGATFELARVRSSHQHKWELATHMTRGALPWCVSLWRYAALPEREFRLTETNRVTTVPKNAKTDRVIAIEPSWNSFFQKGIGGAIRARLQRRVGLLHKDAQERNKLQALIGSRSGTFATIDLKGASDSISLALCELLLPSNLYDMMIQLRSPCGIVLGQHVTYEKMSSMGNGFTFELETALFWALSSSISGDALVYGDDIIVGTDFALPVIDLLREVGFEVNEKKTFWSGPFRESCGGHFFSGVDVTPPYFKKPINSVPEYIGAANRLNTRCERNGYKDGRFQELHALLAAEVPRFLWGPAYVGDGCLHMPFDAVKPRWMPSLFSYSGKMLTKSRKTKMAPTWGALQSALHGDIRVETFPGDEEVIKLSRWYCERWSDQSPWL